MNACCNVPSNYIIQESFKVCSICGKVNSDYLDFSTAIVYTEPEITSKPGYINSKLSKILKWNMYSKEDKNQYKLKKAVKELIQKFNFNENIESSVCELVVSVIKSVGSKRAKIKESIIIVCTYYILKYNNINNYTQYHLAELVGLETKSISKADKIILEFINCESNKENDKINVFNTNEKSIDYITNIVKKYNLDITDDTLTKTEQLITICEDNDILLDHTPLSIGVACFYYILKENNTAIDMKIFSEIYSQSIVTINKTYSKLLPFKEKLNSLLKKGFLKTG
jgi:transcription initiation factor TFIIIB Brf1 subunit/transcription initiation factor TFIIB